MLIRVKANSGGVSRKLRISNKVKEVANRGDKNLIQGVVERYASAKPRVKDDFARSLCFKVERNTKLLV